MKSTLFLLPFVFLVSSCAPATVVSTPQVVTAYATSAAQPWLTELYGCTANSSAVISLVTDPQSAEISLRLGEPEILTAPAFQIDTEEILIITHRESPVQNLSLEAARALFAGEGDPSVQVWVYASGEDVQRLFAQAVMAGISVTSFARLAVDPQHMSDVLNVESNAVGILPRHWKVGDVREVYTLTPVPVLAITRSQPAGVVQDLIACVQR
jgi:hypothetical protein